MRFLAAIDLRLIGDYEWLSPTYVSKKENLSIERVILVTGSKGILEHLEEQ